ncbi:syntaxin 1B 2 3 [Fusarium tjaetaba]|uniref:Syntaxin 1B 2 3 n=1 Tax=Fusarium tjaetaba TaxID=1567544 RepID=A0A8H5W391_9HYPO|nr:syntaxin 1B 2 3 [Fusarium tjaetaba]KAF5643925.1 syntaxin 1B 2 3 [Fusarium tjaetaba]
MASRTIRRGCFEADHDDANLGTRPKQPEKQSLLRSRRALGVATGIRFASLDPTIGPCIAIQESKESKGACTIRIRASYPILSAPVDPAPISSVSHATSIELVAYRDLLFSSYGGQNPYDSPDQGYGGNNGYGNGGGYNSPPAQGYGGSVEMAPLAHNAGGFGQGDPNAILNECRDIDRGIDTVEQNLEQLRMIQQRTLDDADSSGSSAASRQLDSLSADTMSLYRELTERVRTVKSNPEAKSPKNNPHVTRIDRRLKAAITQYQQVESQFRKRTQDQMARQYRIVRPDASEQEIQAAVEDTTGGQVFSQAMMQSDRQGRARAALSAVQDRHKALIKIEQQMVELAQLFQDMDTLVVQQEAAVTQIEQKGEEVVENLDKGNEEIGVAVNTARKTRKKKWICLGICVAIIVVIVIIVLIYIFVIKGQNNDNKKRSIEAAIGSLPVMHTAVLPARLARRVAADNTVSLLNSVGGGRFHLPQLPRN